MYDVGEEKVGDLYKRTLYSIILYNLSSTGVVKWSTLMSALLT
jgi:hypothetical protein